MFDDKNQLKKLEWFMKKLAVKTQKFGDWLSSSAGCLFSSPVVKNIYKFANSLLMVFKL